MFWSVRNFQLVIIRFLLAIMRGQFVILALALALVLAP